MKKQLQQRKVELEKAIQYDWRDLKESLKPRNAAGDFFAGMFNGKEKEKHDKDFFADGISALAARLARKAAEKAEEKFESWFK